MKETWNFVVVLKPQWQTRLLRNANIADTDRIRRIAMLAPRTAPDATMVGCQFRSDDPRLQLVLQELAEEDWEPVLTLKFNDPSQKKWRFAKLSG